MFGLEYQNCLRKENKQHKLDSGLGLGNVKDLQELRQVKRNKGGNDGVRSDFNRK